jgi:phage tail tape-measure protein
MREKRKKKLETNQEKEQNTVPEKTAGDDSHAVGIAAGGSAGAAAGAAIGSVVAGPAGAAFGGAVGAVTGGLAGQAVAEALDPEEEESYWKENFQSRPYSSGRQYDEFREAYRYGWESAAKKENFKKDFEDIESELETSWPSYRNSDKETWNDFREVVRDAYNRVRDRDQDQDKD